MIRFKEILKETELGDRVKREHALKMYEEILKHIRENGRKAFRTVGGAYSSKQEWKILSDQIDSIPKYFDFRIYFKLIEDSSGPRGEFQRSVKFLGNETTPSIRLYIDKSQYDGSQFEIMEKAFEDKREAFIHEFTHYLDRTRIPSPNDLPYTKGINKEYFNDPRELNAYYQQAVGELTARLRSNPDYLENKISDWSDFVDFKDWFFENMVDKKFKNYITDENKRSFIKRLYRFYDQTLPEIENDVLTRDAYG